MMVPLSNKKLNYHFKDRNPSVVSEPRQDNMEMQDVAEKAGDSWMGAELPGPGSSQEEV